MINNALINPHSIVVVGGSENLQKPGGAVLRNIIDGGYQGELLVVNKRYDSVAGCPTFKDITQLPEVDLAILAIPAADCPDVVDVLCNKKGCGAVIILSSGFGEFSREGLALEKKIAEIADSTGTTIIGPNCVGLVTPSYSGVFSRPVVKTATGGVDFISNSGTTIMFTVELAVQHGLVFSGIYCVGNSIQTGVEDILEYLDQSYVHGVSAPVKMLYIESMSNPEKFLKHASSLISKGAQIAAIKSGYSEAGGRAATSHTGALISPDKAVSAMFRKAGIVRCRGRADLVSMAAAMTFPKPAGGRMAIVTHAGGPAVMLTDALSSNGIEIPHLDGPLYDELLTKLNSGSYVGNPIDILTTGTPQQLDDVLEVLSKEPTIDAIAVILGKQGLGDYESGLEVISKWRVKCHKPVYPILPSVENAREEIRAFHSSGTISFHDEVVFADVLTRLLKRPEPISGCSLPPVDKYIIRKIIDSADNGYLNPEEVHTLLEAAGIDTVEEEIIYNKEGVAPRQMLDGLYAAAQRIGWPLVMKVIGPLRKSDVDGVAVNITDFDRLEHEYIRMRNIRDVKGVVLQPAVSGMEIYVGAKREERFGHLITCGYGGIFIEYLKDISYCLGPISNIEAEEMIRHLRSYPLIRGVRGKEGVSEVLFLDVIRRISALCAVAPEIFEMDINPMIGTNKSLIAVDAGIRIEKE